MSGACCPAPAPPAPSFLDTSGITPTRTRFPESLRGNENVHAARPPVSARCDDGVQLSYVTGLAGVVPLEQAGASRRYGAAVAVAAKKHRERRARALEKRAARVEVRTRSGRWNLCDAAKALYEQWGDRVAIGHLCTPGGKTGPVCLDPDHCEAAELKRKIAQKRRKGWTHAQAANMLTLPASHREAERAGGWYHGRAKGQREAPTRLMGCGRDGRVITITCPCCKEHRDIAARCSRHLLCGVCRKKTAAKTQRRIFYARHATILQATRAGLLRKKRKGGRWGERFATLTIPHRGTWTIADRIALAWRAIPGFSARLRRWLKKQERANGWPLAAFFRRFEWTPGYDGLGHPHFHLWIFSPFLPRERVIEWWRAALRGAGCEVEAPIVDVRAAGHGVEKELVKYITKDIVGGGRRLPVESFASVYESLDGKRLSQASRGFMAMADQTKWCGDCARPVPFFRVELVNTWNLLAPSESTRTRAGPEGPMTEDDMLRAARAEGCALEARFKDGRFAGYRKVHFAPDERMRALERRHERAAGAALAHVTVTAEGA